MRLVFTGLRFTNGENQVIATAPTASLTFDAAQRLPGHAPADLDHDRAADHRSRHRPRRRHAAPHLHEFRARSRRARRLTLLIEQLLAEPNYNSLIGQLDTVLIEQAKLTLRDVKTGLTWIAPSARGPPQARRGGRQHRGRSRGSPAAGEPIDVSLSGVYTRDRSRVLARRHCRRPQALDVGRPVARCGAAARPRHRAVRPAAHRGDGQGDVRNVAIDVTGGNGRVTLPGVLPAAHQVKSVNARATVDAATHTAKIERIDIDFGATKVLVTGTGDEDAGRPGLRRPRRGEAHPGRSPGRLLAARIRAGRPAVGAGQSQQRRDRRRRRVRAERAGQRPGRRSRSIAWSACSTIAA